MVMDNRKIHSQELQETVSADEERLLKDFFQTQQQDIEDNGFTNKVMRQLPQTSSRLSTLWTFICVLAGIAFLYFSHALQGLSASMSGLKTELLSIHPTAGGMAVVFICLATLTVAGSYSFFVKENF